MTAPTLLLGDLAYVESARWHDGRLWFAHWGPGEVISVDMAGNSRVEADGMPYVGWSIDWLPDGRMLSTGDGLTRHEPDGTRVAHADLSEFAPDWNELVVDGRGNAYVNGGVDFDFSGAPPKGVICLVTPDGSARKVADGISFPNGMVVTSDNRQLIIAESIARTLTAFDIEGDGSLSNRRVWASDVGPDGITLDADGCVWAQDFTGNACIRVREGGEVIQRVEIDRSPFSCTLGGPDGRTLFILAAEWRGFEEMEQAIADRTGRVLEVEAPAAHAGWP
jgi:sugar lactone lactonase YvrE